MFKDSKYNLSVIVLVKNEERHLPRFFEKLLGLNVYEIIVVDSGSTDNSIDISRKYGARVVEKDWLGNQALQFNWALDNIEIKGDWILRLDADEYLLNDTIQEVNILLDSEKVVHDAYYLKRRHYVKGSWIKQGMYPVNIVRLFKKGKARYNPSMLMDEHLIVEGSIDTLFGDFVDESLLSRVEWFDKHVGYAKREALMAHKKEGLIGSKEIYYKFPIFFRPFLFFFYSIIIKKGILNGKKGFIWFVYQVLFYRFLVDIYILAFRMEGGKNVY